ncbi:hypothetical protein HWV62_4697 [Athelia sp. TMB]|nr:hypothetical protein HWV62_4697 [Athelia sp. TMB]
MPRHRSGHGHHHGMPPRHHADPFEVFNAVFGQFDRHFKEMFPPMPQFQVFPHETRMGMPHRPHDLPALFIPDMPDMYSHSTSHGFPGSAGGHRAMRQESRVTTTINGVTESIWTRTDDNGNEHRTHTYPDGREKYTINGVEQPQQYAPPEPFIPPAPPQIMANNYLAPPIMRAPSHSQRPSPIRHHSWDHNGPYNTG